MRNINPVMRLHEAERETNMEKPEKSTPRAGLNGEALRTSRRDCGLRNATIDTYDKWLGSDACREMIENIIWGSALLNTKGGASFVDVELLARAISERLGSISQL